MTSEPEARRASLADVLPGVAAALGLPLRTGGQTGMLPALPPARHAVVVLVDGLGELLLAQRGGHAPYLRRLRAGLDGSGAYTLQSAFPSTTATSMAVLGTGELPGAHGLVGTEVLDPARDVVFSELAWDPDVDPHRWQPIPTVFQQLAAAGVDVVRVGPGYFDGSGLTEAALRGGRFVAARQLDERVRVAVSAVHASRAAGRSCLVYLYWGDLDKIGHVHGSGSWQWGEHLAEIDAAMTRLVGSLASDTLIAITADHGMVDVPLSDRVDLATDRELAAGVRHVGGEPRALHLYCVPGAAADVLAVWRRRLGAQMEVVARDEAIEGGWFGPVAERVLPRIGDVVVAATGPVAVVDSRTARPELLALIGQHGARTEAERLVPLLLALGEA